MGTYTTNLNLYNTNMATDGNDTFDFQRDINDNNDKIDMAVGKLLALTTLNKTSLVVAINELVANCGTLSTLTTTAKNNLVSAINELVGSLNSFANKTLSNCESGAFTSILNLANSTDKQKITNWGMPDYSAGMAISLSDLAKTNTPFSVPSDGFIRVKFSFSNGWDILYIDDEPVFYHYTVSSSTAWSGLMPIIKGTHNKKVQATVSRFTSFMFYPVKGAI